MFCFKSWLLGFALVLFNSTAFARPSMSDVYDDSGGYWFWIVLLGIGWILKSIFKTGTSIEWGALAMIVIVGAVIFFGLGTAFIGVAQKYPLVAILAIAFVIWAKGK